VTRKKVALAFVVMVCVALAAAILGCFRAPIPMTSVTHGQGPSGTARCLVVLLPGVFDDADDFTKQGFIGTIRASGLSVDIVATNATLGYYLKGKMPEQLFTDVVKPAQGKQRYEQTWLIGMSMGGMGSLLGAQHHASELAGIVALAPYLGNDKTLAAIKAAGGLEAWTPPPDQPITSDNYDAQLWRWLKAATSGQAPAPEIYLGWGKGDKFAEPDGMLAAKLPKDHVFTTDGAHDWPTWNRLLAQILREGSIARTCAR
jgi:pimeloyl-ACP methyl ester carboxylesterase